VSDRISDRKFSLWEKFENKEYRDGFVSSHLANNIAAQIYSTRELRGWTQQELAEKAAMAQERISVMENSSYDKFSLTTLKRLASALDVALVVRFVPFSELTEYATSMGPERLAIREFKNDSILSGTPIATQEEETSSEISIADLPVGQIIDLPLTQRFQGSLWTKKLSQAWQNHLKMNTEAFNVGSLHYAEDLSNMESLILLKSVFADRTNFDLAFGTTIELPPYPQNEPVSVP